MTTLRISGTNIPIVKVLLIDFTRKKVYVIKNDQGNYYHDEASFDEIHDEDISMPMGNVIKKFKAHARFTIDEDGELK
jgi:hypothetical protein